ncbi:LppA family lipoprotein [Nocardia nova]|nr:LppA family lipoprotein [Nocardia nova]
MAATLILTTGCGDMFENPYQNTDPERTAEAAEQLTKLPTLEETEIHVEAAVNELADYVSTLVSGLTWEWANNRENESCDRPYDQTQGSKVKLKNRISHPAIPDAVWPQVLDRARQLAEGIGATGVEVFADEPGNHVVRFYSLEGTELFVGSRGAVIGSNTGCRLPAAIEGAGPTTPPSRPPR